MSGIIPVVDIFAGPGGLGEGFTSYVAPRVRFGIAVSIEKDTLAHATLRLRAFQRQFAPDRQLPYQVLLARGAAWSEFRAAFPCQARAAAAEAVCLELGPASHDEVRTRIRQILPRDEECVLIGGPPCQAYSLVGRARNKGNKAYVAEADKRQTLYIEYLQILADHAPAVFVMENVKGLLSAQLNSLSLFDRIKEDLCDPVTALRREGRPVGRRRPRYRVHSLVDSGDLFEGDPASYVVRAERFGVPQRRHRIILIGVREDFSPRSPSKLIESTSMSSVSSALQGLPRLRSGLSKTDDSPSNWAESLHAFTSRGWFTQIDRAIQNEVRRVLNGLSLPRRDRGVEYWERDECIVLNHSTRSHIVADLERYMFASATAAVRGSSPLLSEFPLALLPQHASARAGSARGAFADRFRVQLEGEPATTVTSHISKDGHYYIHFDPSQCRSLTVREAARLQTFPDDYFFCGPRTSQYHQVGNAVPPLLAQHIAQSVAPLFGG